MGTRASLSWVGIQKQLLSSCDFSRLLYHHLPWLQSPNLARLSPAMGCWMPLAIHAVHVWVSLLQPPWAVEESCDAALRSRAHRGFLQWMKLLSVLSQLPAEGLGCAAA